MRIHVRAVHLAIDRETRARVERRLAASLDRLAHRIQRVGVRIVDENGPRGDADKAATAVARILERGRDGRRTSADAGRAPGPVLT
jgi:hypothetical protein